MFDPVEPLLVNKQDAAKLLGIGIMGLNRLIASGALTEVNLGRGPRSIRFSVEQIRLLIAKRMNEL